MPAADVLHGRAFGNGGDASLSVLLDSPANVMRFYVRGVVYRVPCADIVYMETLNRQVFIHTLEGKICVPYLKLIDCMEKSGGRFVQCYRSLLVNPYYIQEIIIKKRRIILRDGRGELVIGRKYIPGLRHVFDVGQITQYTG